MACITIQSGDRAGERIEMDRDVVAVGRSSDNLIQINAPSVSGHHCVISRTGNQYIIEDPGSTNGTRVNGESVHRRRLTNGDLIAVGEIELLIEGDEIEDYRDVTIPPTMIIQRPPPPSADDGGAAAPVFRKRRSGRGIWLTFGILIGAAAAGALVWFISQLMQS